MTDRLKQIWDGFARNTRAHLTSTEMSAMARPSGTERAGHEFDAKAALAAGQSDQSEAVQAAFASLHADIQRKASRGRRRDEPQQSFDAGADVTPPVGLDDRLLADLKYTEARVRRSGSDYLNFAQERQDQWRKSKRKKFLGIF